MRMRRACLGTKKTPLRMPLGKLALSCGARRQLRACSTYRTSKSRTLAARFWSLGQDVATSGLLLLQTVQR